MPYRLRKYERGSDKRAPPELLALSPLGKSPVITDDDITLAESGAIIGEYTLDNLISERDPMFCQNISSGSMAMERRFPPNLGLLITSTVRSYQCSV